MPPNCSMTGNRLWRLHPRSINRRKAYGAIPGKSLARINVRGTFSLRKIGLCAFSVEPLMTGLAFDGFGIQTLLHLESNGIEDFLFRAP